MLTPEELLLYIMGCTSADILTWYTHLIYSVIRTFLHEDAMTFAGVEEDATLFFVEDADNNVGQYSALAEMAKKVQSFQAGQSALCPRLHKSIHGPVAHVSMHPLNTPCTDG